MQVTFFVENTNLKCTGLFRALLFKSLRCGIFSLDKNTEGEHWSFAEIDNFPRNDGERLLSAI